MADKSSKALEKFAAQYLTGEQRERFIEAIVSAQAKAPAIVWTKPRPADAQSIGCPVEPAAWQPAAVDRFSNDVSPGRHPLHEAGYYYCLDSSSVFEAVPLSLTGSPVSVVDFCASPGGKSILASVLLSPQQLISNEVIGKRAGQLMSNLRRCEIPNVVVTRNDTAVFAQAAAGTASLVLVDAPCSGQSLLAKGIANPGCFHKLTIERNASRQHRILANAAKTVAPGGHILYTTCTFAVQENEKAVEWLCKKFPEFKAVEVAVLSQFRSALSESPCYRLWPFEGYGAGGFTALLRRDGESAGQKIDTEQFRTFVLWDREPAASDSARGKSQL